MVVLAGKGWPLEHCLPHCALGFAFNTAGRFHRHLLPNIKEASGEKYYSHDGIMADAGRGDDCCN